MYGKLTHNMLTAFNYSLLIRRDQEKKKLILRCLINDHEVLMFVYLWYETI